MRLDQLLRREPLGMPRGAGGDGADDQALPVLHQRMPYETELCLLAPPLAVEPRVGVGGRGVRVVAAFLAVKVLLTVAARIGRWAGAVLRPEALGAGPRLQQRAVHREMLVRQQRLDLWLRQHGGEKLARNLAVGSAFWGAALTRRAIFRSLGAVCGGLHVELMFAHSRILVQPKENIVSLVSAHLE